MLHADPFARNLREIDIEMQFEDSEMGQILELGDVGHALSRWLREDDAADLRPIFTPHRAAGSRSLTEEQDLGILVEDAGGFAVDGVVDGEDRGVDVSSPPLAGAAVDGADAGGVGFAGAGEEATAGTALFGVRGDAAVDAGNWWGKEEEGVDAFAELEGKAREMAGWRFWGVEGHFGEEFFDDGHGDWW